MTRDAWESGSRVGEAQCGLWKHPSSSWRGGANEGRERAARPLACPHRAWLGRGTKIVTLKTHPGREPLSISPTTTSSMEPSTRSSPALRLQKEKKGGLPPRLSGTETVHWLWKMASSG